VIRAVTLLSFEASVDLCKSAHGSQIRLPLENIFSPRMGSIDMRVCVWKRLTIGHWQVISTGENRLSHGVPHAFKREVCQNGRIFLKAIDKQSNCTYTDSC
jgi:hypothetical protein